jgi:hypothetical protein
MTILALAEHIERCLIERTDTVLVEKGHTRVTCTATVGRQEFVVTIEEQAKDTQEPALT